MDSRQEYALAEELKRLQRFKRVTPAPAEKFGETMVGFFKHSVQKRQTRLVKVAEAFSIAAPPAMLEHCSIESFHRGTLTILVDSSSHLYELKGLLLAGLQKQLIADCRGTGLSKIALKAGRWYHGEGPERKIDF